MKTFKEFLEESSLSRIKSKSDKSGIAALSADRGDKSRKENQARSKQLQKDIRGKFGRGPTKVKGSYLENPGTKDERKVKEKSYVIDRGKLVLTQTKKTATLHRTRKGGLDKKGENVGRFKPQGKNPYGQSQIKGKTFSYGD